AHRYPRRVVPPDIVIRNEPVVSVWRRDGSGVCRAGILLDHQSANRHAVGHEGVWYDSGFHNAPGRVVAEVDPVGRVVEVPLARADVGKSIDMQQSLVVEEEVFRKSAPRTIDPTAA